MTSSSCLKQRSVPMNNINITPEASYKVVVADPTLFMSSVKRLHSRLGTKFMFAINTSSIDSLQNPSSMEDKERYLTEMEAYREKRRTGQLISNVVPLQQRHPNQNVDIAQADLPIEEVDEEDEEGDSRGISGKSEPHDDHNSESDPEPEEPKLKLNSSTLNLNPNATEIAVAPKENTGDVVMETIPKFLYSLILIALFYGLSPKKKVDEPKVAAAAKQN